MSTLVNYYSLLRIKNCVFFETVVQFNVKVKWRIPGTEEPGGLPSMGSHRVRHD